MDALPCWVDVVTREQAETDLVGAARGLGPDALKKAADRLLALLDEDGPMPDDAERARRRGLWVGKQGRDGMTSIRGNLDPEALATWEPSTFATASRNGPRHPSWTPAKPASTTTTTQNASSRHQTTKRIRVTPGRNQTPTHRNRTRPNFAGPAPARVPLTEISFSNN